MGNNAVDDTLDRQVRWATAGLAASDAVIALSRVLHGAELRSNETTALRGLAEGFIQEAERLRDTKPRSRAPEAAGYARSARALAGASLRVKPTRRITPAEAGTGEEVIDKQYAISYFQFLGDTLKSVATGQDFDAAAVEEVRQILRNLSGRIETTLTTSGETAAFPD